MDFTSISARHPRDTDMPARAFRLAMLTKVLDGSFYDCLLYSFDQEKIGNDYIRVADRRPNVTYRFLKQVVEDSNSFLFGEARMPAVDCADEAVRDLFADLIAEAKLPMVMRQAAYTGSIGSVAIYMRILKARLYFSVLSTVNLTPTYDPEEPDKLLRVVEKYKVMGVDLAAQGYTIPDDQLRTKFWFQRVFDAAGEWWYIPWPVVRDKADPVRHVPRIDDLRSTRHSLGFLPMRWIQNLPGGDDIDGQSTFGPAIDMAIAIDYQLSQAGRALKYSADPVLLLKEPAQSEGEIVRSASNSIVVDAAGDGKLLEINGAASNAVIEYCKWLRECALESLHANRASADRMSAAQSGAALKLHYAPMVQLADTLRSSYGDGLLALMDMVRRASAIVPIKCYGKLVKFDESQRLHLRWPEFFVATPHDRSLEAASLTQLREAGLVSRETAVKELAAEYDVADVSREIALIHQDEAENDAREKALAGALAQVKVNSTIE